MSDDEYRCSCGAFLTEVQGYSGHYDDFRYVCRNPRHGRTKEVEA